MFSQFIIIWCVKTDNTVVSGFKFTSKIDKKAVYRQFN